MDLFHIEIKKQMHIIKQKVKTKKKNYLFTHAALGGKKGCPLFIATIFEEVLIRD